MPTYEYLCETCGHRFEAWQRMSDEPFSVCPQCKAAIHRVVYPVGVVFKGGGFYKTDQTAKSSSTEAKAHETKSAGESSKSDAITHNETKPASAEPVKAEVTEKKPSTEAANTTKEVAKPAPTKQPTTP